MKKFLLAFTLISLSASAMFATLNGNGYYRMKNYGSQRWANMVDNKGSLDKIAGSADLHSLELTKNLNYILSDPGSIVYVTFKSGSQYDLSAQGTSLEKLVDNPISIKANGTADGETLYRLYGVYKGVTEYIGDADILVSHEKGHASISVAEPDFMRWLILPVDVESDNFFGAIPDVSSNQGLFTTMYASFSYKPYSEGVKAYYIGRVQYGMAEMIEITGAVPPATPVIIECAGVNPGSNKLDITTTSNTVKNNSMTGVYFDYKDSQNSNRVNYNPETMRVLGVCDDGSLGFVKADIEYIPSNTAYIKVGAVSPDQIKCVTTEEFENFISGVDALEINESTLSFSGLTIYSENSNGITVFNMAGKTVASTSGNSLDVSGLPKGIYVAVSNGKTLKFVI